MSKALRAGFQRIDQRRRPVPGRFTRLRWKDGTGPVGPSRSRSDFGRAKHSGSVGATWTSTPELFSSAAAAYDPAGSTAATGRVGASSAVTARTGSRCATRRRKPSPAPVGVASGSRTSSSSCSACTARNRTASGQGGTALDGRRLGVRERDRHAVEPTHGLADWTDWTDWTDWKKLLNRAGVRDGRLNDARHTAATVLLLLGVPERAVMGVMGWSKHGHGSAVPARHRCHPTRRRGPCRRPDLAGRRQSRRHRMRPEVRLDGERRVRPEGRSRRFAWSGWR